MTEGKTSEVKNPVRKHGVLYFMTPTTDLPDNAFETCDPNMGSTNVRVYLCNISPCEDE